MAAVVRFVDDGQACWALLRLDNGDPCWISVAQTGVLVKKSKMGLFGQVLFQGDVDAAAVKAADLDEQYPLQRCPEGMSNQVLRVFVNAALHCDRATEVRYNFNRTL
jgi:hypothetical protein